MHGIRAAWENWGGCQAKQDYGGVVRLIETPGFTPPSDLLNRGLILAVSCYKNCRMNARLPLPFLHHQDSVKPDEWNNLMARIRYWPDLVDMEHHIEAKALAIISIARRMICSAHKLGEAVGWKLVFVETSIILFPMLELIGFARLGYGNSDDCLSSGCEWLIDPKLLSNGNRQLSDNPRLTPLTQFMFDHQTAPTISEMIILRHYFLHGLKNVRDQRISIPDIVNYEIPLAIVELATLRIKDYWEQLRNDDGSKEWVNRLARTEIQPFVVQGLTFLNKDW